MPTERVGGRNPTERTKATTTKNLGHVFLREAVSEIPASNIPGNPNRNCIGPVVAKVFEENKYIGDIFKQLCGSFYHAWLVETD